MNKAVYVHRRKDTNEVFYVGIGSKKRAYRKDGRNNLWVKKVAKYGYIVDIVSDNLSWEDACDIECLLISEYGRIDIGTGCWLI